MKKLSFLALCLLTVFAGCRTSTSPSDDGNSVPEKYTVNFSATPQGGGIVTAAIKDGLTVKSGYMFIAGTQIVFTAMPKNDYTVSGWSGADDLVISNGNTQAVLTIKSKVDITVYFQKKTMTNEQPLTLYKLTFAANPKTGGTVKAMETKDGKTISNGAMIAQNTQVMFTAEAHDGFEIGEWTGSAGLMVNADKKTARLTLIGDTAIMVSFTKKTVPLPKPYKVTFSAAPIEGGTVTAKTKDGKTVQDGDMVEENTQVIFTAVSKYGYYLDRWAGSDQLAIDPEAKTAALKVTNDISITATFGKLSIENANWEAKAEITDAEGKKRNVKLVISDGQALTFIADGLFYPVIQVRYDKTSTSIISDGEKDIKIQFLSKPSSSPNWKIRFDKDVNLEDGTAVLHIKNGTEANIKVTFNDRQFIVD